MSPFSSLKRLSINSVKSSKSGNPSVPANGNPSPLDIAYALNVQSTAPTSPWVTSPLSSTSTDGGYAEMLDDDNMSWGASKTPNSRPKNSKRLSFRPF